MEQTHNAYTFYYVYTVYTYGRATMMFSIKR